MYRSTDSMCSPLFTASYKETTENLCCTRSMLTRENCLEGVLKQLPDDVTILGNGTVVCVSHHKQLVFFCLFLPLHTLCKIEKIKMVKN